MSQFRIGKLSRGLNTVKLKDENPRYSDETVELVEFKKSCFNPFEDRLTEAVDQERYLPDVYVVASTAMEIGLSKIEGTEKDSVALLHETWLENDPEKLKEKLIENLEGIEEEKLENLKDLEPEELLETYRKLEGRIGDES